MCYMVDYFNRILKDIYILESEQLLFNVLTSMHILFKKIASLPIFTYKFPATIELNLTYSLRVIIFHRCTIMLW